MRAIFLRTAVLQGKQAVGLFQNVILKGRFQLLKQRDDAFQPTVRCAYDAENKKITQGILPDYSYNLTKISFTCGVCGKTVEITDAATLANF